MRLPSYLRRRMAMLVLAGIKFECHGVEKLGPKALWDEIDIWAVRDAEGSILFGRKLYPLAGQINAVWERALREKVVEPDYGYQAEWVIHGSATD